MAEYLIAHLSDVHIDERADLDNYFLPRFISAARAIIQQTPATVKNIMVLITGDIAKTGKSAEYQMAERCLEAFKTELSKNQISCGFAFVPGNHDCNFSHAKSSYRHIANSINSLNSDDDSSLSTLIRDCLEINEDYYKFCERFNSPFSNEKLVYSSVYEQSKIVVNFINTSWASQLKESQGRPFILSQLSPLKNVPGYLNISIMHHPRSWIDKKILTEFYKKIEDVSDFIFTGHEHTNDAYKVEYLSRNSQVYFEAGAFHSNDEPLCFRSLHINTDAMKFSVIDFYWKDDDRIYDNKQYTDIEIPNNPRANRSGLLLNQKYSNYLQDVGTSIKHPNKQDIKLNDIYIFPRLSVESDDPTEEISEILFTPAELFDKIKGNRVAVISGDATSGKTSLCKEVYSYWFRQGGLPVLINGKDIASNSGKVFENTIQTALSLQYQNDLTIKNFQRAEYRPLLIIDDFEGVEDECRDGKEIISLAKKYFDKIVVTTESAVELRMISDIKSVLQDTEVAHIRVMPMNQAQRRELVSRWLTIGSPSEVGINNTATHLKEMYISVLVNELGVPSHPLYILTCLQLYEAGKTETISMTTNAKLFEAVITLSIESVEKTTISLNSKLAYLGSLANRLYEIKREKLSCDDIHKFHEEYCDFLDIDISEDRMWGELSSARVLIKDIQEGGGFRYNYIKQYFYAEFLKSRIRDPKTVSAIEEMINNVHISGNANVLSLLTISSTDSWILRKVQENLNDTLKGLTPASYKELSAILSAKRIAGEKGSEPQVEAKSIASVPDPKVATDWMLMLSQAIRLIRVMGHLVKNSANLINAGEKRELITSMFDSANRLVGFKRDAFNEEKEEFLSYLKDKIRENRPDMSDGEMNINAENKLRRIVFWSSVGLIGIVSRSVGDELMHRTFEKISNSTDGKYDAYLTAIKIDWYKNFPKEELIEKYLNEKKHSLYQDLIRYLAMRGLIDRGGDLGMKVLQEICSKLDLDPKAIFVKSARNTKALT